MTSCLDDATIERLVAGQIAELDALERHLDSCSHCRERLAAAARTSKPAIPPTITSGALEQWAEPSADPLIGRILADRYLVRRRIGGGAMGTVYEAEHALIGRRVAIKVLQAQWAQSREVVRRFANEARAAGTLGHPGILAALDLGRTEDGRPFLVLEYLQGSDMEGLLARQGRLSVGRAARIAVRIADALSAAHAAGIVHRDLKPENVFLTDDGALKVLDFGISKITASHLSSPATRPGAVMGTPMYMAPEQLEDAARADPRSDVYGLGVILYRSLTGELPFSAPTLPALLLAIVSQDPPSPRALRPDLPEAIDAIVRRAMAPKPDDRFRTMEELADALAPFVQETDELPQASEIASVDRRVATVLVAVGLRDFEDARRRVEERGARVLPRSSAALLVAAFGERTWHGDEPLRAVEAALGVRPLADAIAVASGHLAADGDDLHGEPIERAERACEARLPGVAVIGTPTRIESRFLLRQIDSELVEVTAARPTSVIPPPIDVTPLVGRESERTRLNELIERATSEQCPIIAWVSGEPGAGKSRLASEAIGLCESSFPAFSVLVGRGVPHGGRRLGMLADALLGRAREATRNEDWPRIDPPASLEERREAVRRMVAQAVSADEEREIATFCGELLGVSMPPTSALSAARSSPRLMRDRMTLALSRFLEGLSEQKPLAIVIDDLQWVDSESLELIDRLVHHSLFDRALFVLGTARAELFVPRPPFDSPDATEIRLRGLSLADVRSMAMVSAGVPVDDAFARALLERTGGNPLFIEQIVRALVQRGEALSREGPWPMPLDVEAAVQARLDALDAPRRALLERLAVLGAAASAEELEELGVSGASRTIALLVREGLVRRRPGPDASTPRFELRTSLMADVLSLSLPEERRNALHLVSARVLSRREQVDDELLASHFERAGAAHEAANAYARAARDAARQTDGARVLRCAERAIELGVDDASAFALDLACAEILEHEGRLELSGTKLQAAAAVASTPEERARVTMAKAIHTLRREGPSASTALFSQALEDAHASGEASVLARVLGAQAMALISLGNLDEANGIVAEAERLVQTRAPMLRAELASWRAQLAAAQGDLGARRNAFRAALELYEELGDERNRAGVCVNLGDVLNRFGAYAEAEVTLMDAQARCRRLGLALMEGYALVNLAYARLMAGRSEHAELDLARANELASRIGDTHLALWASIYAARLALYSEKSLEAIARAEQAAERAQKLGHSSAEISANVVLAQARLARGDAKGALAAARRAEERREALGGVEEAEAELYVILISALEANGEHEQAAIVKDRGRRWLASVARRIADPEWRKRFLEDVPAHRTLA